MIHVAEFDGGRIRLEISNQEEFIRKVKKEARRQKKRSGTWKIRIIGTDRVSAPIQHLIDDLAGQKTAPAETERDLRTAVGDGIGVKPLGHTPPDERPARPRPGGPLTSN